MVPPADTENTRGGGLFYLQGWISGEAHQTFGKELRGKSSTSNADRGARGIFVVAKRIRGADIFVL